MNQYRKTKLALGVTQLLCANVPTPNKVQTGGMAYVLGQRVTTGPKDHMQQLRKTVLKQRY